MKIPLDMQGFKFSDSPYRWELAPVDAPVTTLQLLLEKFYEEWTWHAKPLGWVRNPENREGDSFYGPHADVIVAPCRCSFYFVIERQFNEQFGPHKVVLYYRSQWTPGELAWVSICQIEGLWHSDKRIYPAFLAAIREKELYQSEATAATIVLK